MAEIGVVASVIQVAGAGLKLSQTLYQYADGVATADRRIKDIAKDVQLTSFIIEELAHIFKLDSSSTVLSERAIKTADDTVKECSDVFTEINKAITKTKKSSLGKFLLPFRDPKLELLRTNIDRLKANLQLLMQVLTHAHQIASQKLDREAEAVQREQIKALIQNKKESTKRYEESLRNFGSSGESTFVSDDEEEPVDRDINQPTGRGLVATASVIGSSLTARSLEKCVHHIQSLLEDIENLQQVLSGDTRVQDTSEHHESVIGSYFRARETLDTVILGSSKGRHSSDTIQSDSGDGKSPRRIACVLCRKRKLRCDGARPACGTCKRLVHDCAYAEVRKKSGPKRGYVKSLETRFQQVEQLLKTQETGDQNQDSKNTSKSSSVADTSSQELSEDMHSRLPRFVGIEAQRVLTGETLRETAFRDTHQVEVKGGLDPDERTRLEAEFKKAIAEAQEKAKLEERMRLEKELMEAKSRTDKNRLEEIQAEARAKLEKEKKKSAEQASKAKELAERQLPIKFQDAVGRNFSFPWNKCKTWAGMEELIKSVFKDDHTRREHVEKGRYDLTGPDNHIILPQLWEYSVQPGWSIRMYMLPGISVSSTLDDSNREQVSGNATSRSPIMGNKRMEQEEAAFWIPQATPDGRLFYFDSLTGVSNMELPSETPLLNRNGSKDRPTLERHAKSYPPRAHSVTGQYNLGDTDKEKSVSDSNIGEDLPTTVFRPRRETGRNRSKSRSRSREESELNRPRQIFREESLSPRGTRKGRSMFKLKIMGYGRIFILEVDPEERICDIKRLIEVEKGWPATQQNLINGGVTLKDNAKLASCIHDWKEDVISVEVSSAKPNEEKLKAIISRINAENVRASDSTRQSVAKSEESVVKATTFSFGPEMLPKYSYGLDDESDISTNPSVVQGPLGAVDFHDHSENSRHDEREYAASYAKAAQPGEHQKNEHSYFQKGDKTPSESPILWKDEGFQSDHRPGKITPELRNRSRSFEVDGFGEIHEFVSSSSMHARHSRETSQIEALYDAAAGGAGYQEKQKTVPLERRRVSTGMRPFAQKANVTSACVNCKDSHLECDGERPCARCVASKKQDTCRYMLRKTIKSLRLSDDYNLLGQKSEEKQHQFIGNPANSLEKSDYVADDWGDVWPSTGRYYPTRLSDELEEDERSRTPPSHASQATTSKESLHEEVPGAAMKTNSPLHSSLPTPFHPRSAKSAPHHGKSNSPVILDSPAPASPPSLRSGAQSGFPPGLVRQRKPYITQRSPDNIESDEDGSPIVKIERERKPYTASSFELKVTPDAETSHKLSNKEKRGKKVAFVLHDDGKSTTTPVSPASGNEVVGCGSPMGQSSVPVNECEAPPEACQTELEADITLWNPETDREGSGWQQWSHQNTDPDSLMLASDAVLAPLVDRSDYRLTNSPTAGSEFVVPVSSGLNMQRPPATTDGPINYNGHAASSAATSGADWPISPTSPAYSPTSPAHSPIEQSPSLGANVANKRESEPNPEDDPILSSELIEATQNHEAKSPPLYQSTTKPIRIVKKGKEGPKSRSKDVSRSGLASPAIAGIQNQGRIHDLVVLHDAVESRSSPNPSGELVAEPAAIEKVMKHPELDPAILLKYEQHYKQQHERMTTMRRQYAIDSQIELPSYHILEDLKDINTPEVKEEDNEDEVDELLREWTNVLG
jgi:hypothetical protein